MAGVIDLYKAFCKTKSAKYFRKYRATMNSLEKANPTANKEFEDWLED